MVLPIISSRRRLLTATSVNFPVVESSSSVRGSVAATSHPITLPSGIQNGDIIVVNFAVSAALSEIHIDPSSGNGWVFPAINHVSVTPSFNHAILWKIANGDDDLTLRSSISGISSYTALRISNAESVWVSSLAQGINGVPNPPSFTVPIGGSQKYLWVAAGATGDNVTYTAAPTNYTDLLHANSGGVSGAPNCVMAIRELEGTVENPGGFSASGNHDHSARTIAIVPAVGALTDVYFPLVSFLCGFEGVDGATAASNEGLIACNLSFINQAQIDTDQKKFGSSSLLLDGTGDSVDLSSTEPFHFWCRDFTAEFWVRFNNITTAGTFIASWNTTFGRRAWRLEYTGSTTQTLRFRYSTNNTNDISISGSWTPTTGVWYHVAVCRSSGVLRLFVDGVMLTSSAFDTVINQSLQGYDIGTGQGVANLNGWSDEWRMSLGYGRYYDDGGFSVPTSAFPRG